MDGWITAVSPDDRQSLAQVDRLLVLEGIRRDANLDYICAMRDEEGQVVATGSAFGPTLRCFAVRHDHQGEGLLNQIIAHLIEERASRGLTHLFVYTKPDAARFFGDLGFHEIARVEGSLVFMENRRHGFPDYLAALAPHKKSGLSAAIVMNANPFTLGHRYLVEQAASACDHVHLFVVSEDLSLVPFRVRRMLVKEGTSDLSNVCLHDCGPYIISSATFPSYFLKDEEAVITGQARLDLAVFARIAQALNITVRYVGQEPESLVTGIYNRIMAESLPALGIACRVVPRLTADGRPISAGTVREAIKNGDADALKALVPPSTYRYFTSPEAAPVLERIRSAAEVRHY